MENIIDTVFEKIMEMENIDYPLLPGYHELEFDEFKFQYSSKEEDYDAMYDSGERRLEKMDFECVQELSDYISIYKNKKRLKAIVLSYDVPTFDSCDCKWDSYRKLFLIPTKKEVVGFLVAGGYQIASVYRYSDIRWGDKRTEEMMKATGMF